MERFMDDDMLVEHGKDTTQMWVKYEDCVQEIALTKADAQATIAALQKEIATRDSTDSILATRIRELEARLTQRTAERDTARRRVDELEAREVDVVMLREDLEQRTEQVAALQARVKELEDDRSAWKEIAQDWSAAAKLAEQPEKFYEGYSAAVMNAMQALLTKARADLARVTAELEAAQARVRELEESRDAWRASQECSEKAYMALVNQIPAERFDYDPINVALLDGAKEQEIIGRKQIADLQAELERVSAERDELKGQRDTMQEHINLAVPKLQEADTLRTLILALPKVEGEITCSQQFDSAWRLHYWQVEAYGVADECLYRLSNLREEEAKAYAALLKHRQGMEG